MKAAHPYLNFNGNTLDAFTFYRSVFGGEFPAVLRYRDFGGNSMGVPEQDLDKIAHIALPLGQNMLMGTDAVESMGEPLVQGTNFSITLEPESLEEAERVFDALSEGGRIQMPLSQTEWAEKYGMFTDRFGIQWMVSYEGNVRFPGASST
jgi:PhnB protein